jgi:hypothetical protein
MFNQNPLVQELVGMHFATVDQQRNKVAHYRNMIARRVKSRRLRGEGTPRKVTGGKTEADS